MQSRERFFLDRVREHLQTRGFERGMDFLRAARKSNAEYEGLLEQLLTQETTFFRYPAVYEAFQKRALPELHTEEVLGESAHVAYLECGLFHGRRAVFDRDYPSGHVEVCGSVECRDSGHRS